MTRRLRKVMKRTQRNVMDVVYADTEVDMEVDTEETVLADTEADMEVTTEDADADAVTTGAATPTTATTVTTTKFATITLTMFATSTVTTSTTTITINAATHTVINTTADADADAVDIMVNAPPLQPQKLQRSLHLPHRMAMKVLEKICLGLFVLFHTNGMFGIKNVK